MQGCRRNEEREIEYSSTKTYVDDINNIINMLKHGNHDTAEPCMFAKSFNIVTYLDIQVFSTRLLIFSTYNDKSVSNFNILLGLDILIYFCQVDIHYASYPDFLKCKTDVLQKDDILLFNRTMLLYYSYQRVG